MGYAIDQQGGCCVCETRSIIAISCGKIRMSSVAYALGNVQASIDREIILLALLFWIREKIVGLFLNVKIRLRTMFSAVSFSRQYTPHTPHTTHYTLYTALYTLHSTL